MYHSIAGWLATRAEYTVADACLSACLSVCVCAWHLVDNEHTHTLTPSCVDRSTLQ